MTIPGRVPATIFGAIVQMAQRRPVFTASFYSVDSITGKVASFIDWNDIGHVLTQSTGNLQVPLPVTHSDFANNLCVTFPFASAYYTSSRIAAYWTYLNNESTAYAVLTPMAGSAFSLWFETADSTSEWLLHRNTTLRGDAVRTGTSNLCTAGGGTATDNVPLAIEFRVSASANQRAIRGTSHASSTVSTVTGTLETMPNTLTIGGRAGLGIGFGSMRWAFFTPMNSLSQAERDAMAGFLFSLYGLALP